MSVLSFFRFKAALFLYGFIEIRSGDLDEISKIRLAREYRAWMLERNQAFLEEVKGSQYFRTFSDLLAKRNVVEEALSDLLRVNTEAVAGKTPVGFLTEEDGGECPVFDMTGEERDPIFDYVDLLAKKQRVAIGTRCPTSDLLMFCDEDAFSEDVMRAVILHEAYCERCLNVWNGPISDGSADKLIGGALRGDDDHLKADDIARYLALKKTHDIVGALEKPDEDMVFETESHLCYCISCQRKVVRSARQ